MRSLIIGICAEVQTPDYPEIYICVSLTLCTLGIHHSFKKKFSCFAPIVPLLHFSIAYGCYTAALCKNQKLLVLRFSIS